MARRAIMELERYGTINEVGGLFVNGIFHAWWIKAVVFMAASRTFKEKLADRFGSPVNSGFGLMLGITVAAGTGMFALHTGNLDEGQVVTLAQIRASRKDDAERIKNDPHMPPQAKAIALRMLGHGPGFSHPAPPK